MTPVRTIALLPASVSVQRSGMPVPEKRERACKASRSTRVHGAWSNPMGACVAHFASFDPATGGHARFIGQSNPDGSGTGTYSGRWHPGK
jgi:hypothetical protein